MSYTKPLDEPKEVPKRPRTRALRKDDTDWQAIADELREEHLNQWRVLDVEKYQHCSESKAKYAMHKLRKVGLEADKHRHYHEHKNVPQPDGSSKDLREYLDEYSVHVMWFETEEPPT